VPFVRNAFTTSEGRRRIARGRDASNGERRRKELNAENAEGAEGAEKRMRGEELNTEETEGKESAKRNLRREKRKRGPSLRSG